MTFRIESLYLNRRDRLNRIRVCQTSSNGETDKSRCQNYLIKSVIDRDYPGILIPGYRDDVCETDRVLGCEG